MKTKVILLALALGASTPLLTAQDVNQRPDDQPPPGREAGPGIPSGPGGPGGFHLVPPRAREQLNLTADQQRRVADLEAKIRTKLEKILTPEQMEQLRQMRPPQRQAGPGAPGGAGGFGEQGGRRSGPGGPGGMGGERPVMPIIAALDLNKDGTIDAKEIAQASKSLKKLDKNGDGKLTPDEYLPRRGQGGPWMRGFGGPGGPGGFGGPGGPGMRGPGAPGGQGGPNGPGGPPPGDDQNPPRQSPPGE